MNPEVKAKWLEALRSGNYWQGSNLLSNHPGDEGAEYCCLGVLCDLAVNEGIIPAPKLDIFGNADYGATREGLPLFGTQFPPPEVVEWAGLDDFDPAISHEDGEDTLSNVNDEGWSFVEIAKAIEEQL